MDLLVRRPHQRFDPLLQRHAVGSGDDHHVVRQPSVDGRPHPLLGPRPQEEHVLRQYAPVDQKLHEAAGLAEAMVSLQAGEGVECLLADA
jgi:hypothetical protein